MRLPGVSPWDPEYVAALARMMRTVQQPDVDRLRGHVPTALPEFDLGRQRARVTAFVREFLDAHSHRRSP